MTKLNELWKKNRVLIFCVAVFSATYVTMGYLWFLAPQEKFHPGRIQTNIEKIAPMLGWAVPFLNSPPYVFIPGLAIAGGLAGWLIWRLLRLKWPNKLLGAILLVVLVFINYYVGLFLYLFAVLIW